MDKNIMWDGVRRRIQERLDALGLKPTPVSKQAELGASYLAEFLGKRRAGKGRGRPSLTDTESGGEWLPPKKTSIRDDGMRKLADVLECDVEYLYGLQDEPRGTPIGPKLPVFAIIGSGIATTAGRENFGHAADLGIRALPAYPASGQKLYVVQDDHAASMGYPAGSYVVAVPVEHIGRAIRTGDEVVATAKDGDMIERTIRRVAASPEGTRPVYPEKDPPKWPDVGIEGVVIFSARYRG